MKRRYFRCNANGNYKTGIWEYDGSDPKLMGVVMNLRGHCLESFYLANGTGVMYTVMADGSLKPISEKDPKKEKCAGSDGRRKVIITLNAQKTDAEKLDHYVVTGMLNSLVRRE